MTTTTTTTPSSGLHLPTDARPIAMLATTQSTATREMSEFLTRRFGPGLVVKRERGRTVWLLPASRKQVTR